MEPFLDYNFFIYEPLKAYSLGIFSEKEAIQRFKRRVYNRIGHIFIFLDLVRGIEFSSIQAYNRSDEVAQLTHNLQLLFEQLESLYRDNHKHKKEEKEKHTNEASNEQKPIKRRRIGKSPDGITNGLYTVYQYYERMVDKTLEIINLSEIIIKKLDNSTNLNDDPRIDLVKKQLNYTREYCYKYKTTSEEEYTADSRSNNNKRGELISFPLSSILYIEHQEELKSKYESIVRAQDGFDEDYIYDSENDFIESRVIEPYLLMLLKVAIAYDDFEKTSILLSSIYDTLSKLNPNLFESKADFVPAAHDLIQSFKDCPINFTKAFFYCLSRYGLICSEAYEKTIFALNQGDELILVTALSRETEAKKLINKCSSLFKLASKLNQCETIDCELSKCADCVLKALSPIASSNGYTHKGNGQYVGIAAINEEIKKLDLFDSSKLVVFMDVATANGIYELKHRGAQKLLSHIKLISVEPNKKAQLVENGLDEGAMNAPEIKDSIESTPDSPHLTSFEPHIKFDMSELYLFLIEESVVVNIGEKQFTECIENANIKPLWETTNSKNKLKLALLILKDYYKDQYQQKNKTQPTWFLKCCESIGKSTSEMSKMKFTPDTRVKFRKEMVNRIKV